MNAIETTGVVNGTSRIELDTPLDIPGPRRVRVILLFSDTDEPDEAAWNKAAAKNPAFDFLHDAAEDIYTRSDGKPFDDQR